MVVLVADNEVVVGSCVWVCCVCLYDIGLAVSGCSRGPSEYKERALGLTLTLHQLPPLEQCL